MAMRIVRDQDGGVLVEAAVMLTLMFVFVLGGIDFLFAFYQWNAAAKAVQLGARIAAVSDPVASGLVDLSTAVGGTAGDPMPAFSVVCIGTGNNTGTCTCTGTCTGVSGYNAAAMKRLVYGRGNGAATACQNVTGSYNIGMCNMFSRVTPANVIVTYTQTGLGVRGLPTGPVPTIDVSLTGINFQAYFIGRLLGNIPMSRMKASMTGEDLSSTGT
jgi:Flp pilus assembly protein TadG